MLIGISQAEPVCPHQGDHRRAAGRRIIQHVRDHVADAPGCVWVRIDRNVVDRNDDGKLDRVRGEEEQPQRAITPRIRIDELIDAIKNVSVRADRNQEIVSRASHP